MADIQKLIDRSIALINFSGRPDPLGLSFTHHDALREVQADLRRLNAGPIARRGAIDYFWHEYQRAMAGYKRKYPFVPKFSNGGFPKRARTTTKYGGTGKKYADKYGGKGMDAILYEAERLANSAAKKQSLKVSETLRSQSGFRMDTFATPYNQVGFGLSGLNQTSAYVATDPFSRGNRTNACFVFPLSPMSQLGNSGVPGFRTGQKINVHSLDLNLIHYQGIASITGTYNMALLRNISTTITGSTYATPGLASTDSLNLFLPLNQGPLSSSGGPNGTLPNGDFSSMMPWNRGDWRVCKKMSWTMAATPSRENVATANDPASSGGSTRFTNSKTVRFHYDFKDQVWNYAVPASTNGITGGDYYVIIWREGVGDAIIGRDRMEASVTLTYKDP